MVIGVGDRVVSGSPDPSFCSDGHPALGVVSLALKPEAYDIAQPGYLSGALTLSWSG